jgi:hypothetical protein
VPDQLTQARTHIATLAADRQRRGTPTRPEDIDAAAKLLIDLWAAAARHGIIPDHPAWSFHLPRVALDTVCAASSTRSKGRNGRGQSLGQRRASSSHRS